MDTRRKARRLTRVLTLAALVIPSLFLGLGAAAAPPKAPELLSIFPLGGRQGSTYQAEIRGKSLEGVYEIWSDTGEFEGRILGVEAEKEPDSGPGKNKKPKKDLVQRLSLTIAIKENAKSGPHRLRLISPGGLSNPLTVHVHREPSVLEAGTPHDLATEAQPLAKHPIVVHGRIAENGEVDYYSFEAVGGETLRFEVASSEALDPALALYEPAGSWFDPRRTTRLAFSEEPVSYPGLSTEPALTYRFEKKGTYLVRVNGFLGTGGPEYIYQLRIAPVGPAGEEIPSEAPREDTWKERTWTRELRPDRIRVLWSRAVESLAVAPGEKETTEGETVEGNGPRGAEAIPDVPIVRPDADPSLPAGEPKRITIPSLLSGAIVRPGDIDRVKFSVKAGDRLVLEVETPDKTLPLFNPFLRVLDEAGIEAYTNIHSRVNANSVVSKQIQPKTVYAFPRDGEFTIEIRDITATYGDESFAYRVMVRQGVPHIGEIQVAEDYLNLVAGKAQKLTVVTDQEEGFDGFIALQIEGLPEGVTAVTATEVEPDKPPPFNEGKKERYAAKSQKATFVLAADEDAPPTRRPVRARLNARAVMKGVMGRPIFVKDLLLMVVRPEEALPEHGVARSAEAR